MLSSLHKDHLNIARLLTLLKHKLAAIRHEQQVSYFLLRDVVDYLREVSDKHHHPKEDMIYDYYLKYRVVEERSPTACMRSTPACWWPAPNSRRWWR